MTPRTVAPGASPRGKQRGQLLLYRLDEDLLEGRHPNTSIPGITASRSSIAMLCAIAAPISPSMCFRDPGARFTFGKYLTPALKLVYSVGLNDPEARFVLGQYRFRLGRELTAKAQREDGGRYTYGVGQRIRWGAPPRGEGGGAVAAAATTAWLSPRCASRACPRTRRSRAPACG